MEELKDERQKKWASDNWLFLVASITQFVCLIITSLLAFNVFKLSSNLNYFFMIGLIFLMFLWGIIFALIALLFFKIKITKTHLHIITIVLGVMSIFLAVLALSMSQFWIIAIALSILACLFATVKLHIKYKMQDSEISPKLKIIHLIASVLLIICFVGAVSVALFAVGIIIYIMFNGGLGV